MRIIRIVIVLVIFSLSLISKATPALFDEGKNDHQSEKALHWADSIINTLTLEEQIGQLIMIRAHSDKSLDYKQKVSKHIKKFGVGGICFFQGGPVRQANWAERYQNISNLPLLVAIDGEWGLGMRLDSTLSYPYQMTLGAIQDNHYINMMGKAVAEELKTVGVNMNFAPVMDVNNNPANPVINFRSFGEEPENVYQKAKAYALGMQSEGVIACGKHFPGHGDTDKDSHHTLPVIGSSEKEMKDVHLYPFRKASKDGLGAIMSAHIHVPALDTTENRPASLSRAILHDILVNQYNYNGLIITDALEMAGVRKGFDDGEIAVSALKAGNDILLMPADLSEAISAVKTAVENKELSKKELLSKVRKVLMYKYWIQQKNQTTEKSINKASIDSLLNLQFHKSLIQKLYKEALTLIKNDTILPLGNLSKKNIAVVSISNHKESHFADEIKKYAPIDEYHISSQASQSAFKSLLEELENYDLVISGIHTNRIYPGRSNYGIPRRTFDFTDLLGQRTKNIVVLFGNPYALKSLYKENNLSALLVAYQNNEYSQNAAVQGIFGGTPITGKLPVSVGEIFESGQGLSTQKTRLEESSPYFLNIDASKLDQIDSIIKDGMEENAYPGCQVLVAKDGKIFYDKTFGYHTYNKIRPVEQHDIYDLASVTKVAATTLSIMRLHEEGKLDIDQPLSKYLPALQNTNKQNLIIRDIMAHQARLKPWIPFYKATLDNHKKLNPSIYKNHKTTEYNQPVARNLYIKNKYKDSIIKTIGESPLRYRKRYKYSDLGFYLLKFAIDSVAQQPLDEYVENTFYEPMGLFRTTFLPLQEFDKREIVPTEDDLIFRDQLIHGYVHDPGAAMLGGVAGHAGLFSTSRDLAALMQMLLNNGSYAGKKYLDSSTIKEFTRRQFPLNNNRRGIGFDKPLPDNQNGGPTCREASNESFGHSGFTGTYIWADPKYDLVYIFLSNRIHPSAENRKLISMDIRTKIQKVIYQAVVKKDWEQES
ncbi:MAG: serine hydrolase [Bacteroidales bacterium]|nr:serine hydrolase [Bacteroidales bacterium]MCF8327694.1 serine hydrolase [Bacteroidales bacterium]